MVPLLCQVKLIRLFLEVVNQVAFNIIGNDVTITMAAEAGQLELNAFEPIIFYCMFQSIDTLGYAVQTLVDNCIVGITANEERCRYLVENSVGIITAISPHLGYQKAADIAKKAIKTGESVRSLILKEKLMDEDELNRILDPIHMTEPGISGKDYLIKKIRKNRRENLPACKIVWTHIIYKYDFLFLNYSIDFNRIRTDL